MPNDCDDDDDYNEFKLDIGFRDNLNGMLQSVWAIDPKILESALSS